MPQPACVYTFTLRDGVVTKIPSLDDVLAIIAQQLSVTKDQARSVLVNFDCPLKLFYQTKDHQHGSLILANVEQAQADLIGATVASQFEIADLYIKQTKCPYCGGEHIISLKPVHLDIVQYAHSGINSQIELIPAYCSNCGLGFNVQECSSALRSAMDMIYALNYSSPVREHSNQENAFSNMLCSVQKHIAKDAHIAEIGSFDGYLIMLLQKYGYTNLTGFDPNPNFEGDLPIIKEPFCTATVPNHFEKSSLDAVVSHNTIEAIPDLHDLLQSIHYCLKLGGVFITQVPTPLVVNSLQRYRMPIAFLERWCHDYGFEIVEISPNNKPYSLNQHILIVAKKVAYDIKNKPALASVFADEKERESNIAEYSVYADRLTFNSEHMARLGEKITAAAAKGKEVILYGSGITTGKILAGLANAGISPDFSHWAVCNSNAHNEKLQFKAPNGHCFKLHYAKEYLKDKNIGLLIFCVQNEGYRQEIEDTLKEINCTFDDSFYQDYLK